MLRAGIDLVEIQRIQDVIARHGDRFLQRIYTQAELTEFGDNLASLAARFAAKEAVGKALVTGIRSISWQEIEVLRGPAQEPVLRLYGNAARLAEEQKLKSWSISISHSSTHAIAMVIASCDD